MTTPLIEFEHVNRRFGGGVRVRSLARLRVQRRPYRQVLQDVSFAVEAGEWTAIMGTNGSGKTTILKMVAGLVRPQSGTVRVDGMDVRTNGNAVRRLVGYSLADERSFQWRLTARENLRFFASLEGFRGADRARRVNELLEVMDLSAYADQPFGVFSTGVRQRLAIARALLTRPRVLLLDEPTRSLDTQHAAGVWRAIRAEMDVSGGSVLVATHRTEEAAEYCQQLWVLKDGILREQSSHRSRSGMPRHGLAIMVRGLSTVAADQLRNTEGIHNVEAITIAGRESILEVRADGREASLSGLMQLLAQHGGTIEAVQEQVIPTNDQRTPAVQPAEIAS